MNQELQAYDGQERFRNALSFINAYIKGEENETDEKRKRNTEEKTPKKTLHLEKY